MKKKDLIASFSVCRGTVRAWNEWTPVDYDAPEQARSWVEYEDDQGIATIVRVESLCELAYEVGCSLECDARRAPVELATIVSVLLDLDRVVSDYDFYDFLESKYGIDVRGNLPRVEGTMLRFMTIEPRGRFPPVLTAFSLDLRSGAVARSHIGVPGAT